MLRTNFVAEMSEAFGLLRIVSVASFVQVTSIMSQTASLLSAFCGRKARFQSATVLLDMRRALSYVIVVVGFCMCSHKVFTALYVYKHCRVVTLRQGVMSLFPAQYKSTTHTPFQS
jgi:hypothetical protein